MRGYCKAGSSLVAAFTVAVLSTTATWGFFFDDRREMGLSGFAYTRWVIATQDGLGVQKRTYHAGNLVSHRNFLTLEWRHNIARLIREVPTIGAPFRFLDFDAFDYYLNMRLEYDAAFAYGPNKMRRMLKGTRLKAPYLDDPNTPVPFDGLYFTPFPRAPWPAGRAAADSPADVQALSNRRWHRELREPNLRLFEWYFNITKGPLFLRIGKQNLSWGETDGFRLLDQINPLDNSFGGFLTALDERRVPLNMLRAQWSFGTVGPIQDLTLEGFVAPDNGIALPGIPTSAVHYWHAEHTNGNTAIMYGRTPCGGHFMAKRGIPPRPELGYRGSGSGPNQGGGCSQHGLGPRTNLDDVRGGGRILGTIRDFTFSIAHYYTYQDIPVVRAHVISPTTDHLRWDLGLPTDSFGRPWADNLVEIPGIGRVNTANPWGPNDPLAARMISSGANPFGRGGIGTVAGGERNIRSTLNFPRYQVTGASLSFPVNALTGMLVDSDHPLYYIYTTFRSEIAFFNNYPTMRAYAHGDGTTAFSRFLGFDMPGTIVNPDGTPDTRTLVFRPGGPLAHQAGRRTARIVKRDWLVWNIGLDHNQWIRWLNPTNSFLISVQQFWAHRNGMDNNFDQNRPPSVLNDKDIIAARQRRFTKPVTSATRANLCSSGSGSRRGCSTWDFPSQEWLTTLAISTPYLSGNLTPRFTFFYDWSGSYLVQPGIDWTFWDPFRFQIRYSYLEGRGRRGLGGSNRKDNVWFELQYLLY